MCAYWGLPFLLLLLEPHNHVNKLRPASWIMRNTWLKRSIEQLIIEPIARHGRILLTSGFRWASSDQENYSDNSQNYKQRNGCFEVVGYVASINRHNFWHCLHSWIQLCLMLATCGFLWAIIVYLFIYL